MTRAARAQDPRLQLDEQIGDGEVAVEALHRIVRVELREHLPGLGDERRPVPQVAGADYELRLLKVPAVYLVALWLHRGGEDILIPMGDPPGSLKANRPYSEADVIAALRDIAIRNKQFQDAYDKNQRAARRKKGQS